MTGKDGIVILMPTYEDWESVLSLSEALNAELAAGGLTGRIVVVDDGSPHFADPEAFGKLKLSAISEVRVVTLLRNLGNQRALAIGLGYVAKELPGSVLVVMDADFEDQPHYVPELVAKAHELGNRVVFAERTERSESWSFKAFYTVYQYLYKLLTGMPISIGNFSAIPARLVRRVAGISEIWNHFPAGIMRARVPFATVPSQRGTRRFGKSKMNLVPLVIHGLSGLAVHADVVGVRAVLGILGLGLLLLLGMGGVVVWRLFFNVETMGWSSQIITLMGGIVFQAFMSALFIVFLVLASRNHRMVIPAVDYEKFVMDAAVLYPGKKPRK